MKKILFFISILLCTNFMFAQTTATLTMPEIDVSGLNAGDEILVPINVEAISNMVEGFQVFLGFDDDIMTWNGANTAPAPGVNATHPGLTALGPDWLWNNNVEDELAFSWVEPTFYNPVTIGAGEDLIVLSFTYHGGLVDPMPIIFGQPVDKVMSDDGTMVKWGPTELYDEFFGIYELTLNDGSLTAGVEPGTDWIGDVSDEWNNPANWTMGVPTGDPLETVNIDATITKATFAPTIYGSAVAGTLNLLAGTLAVGPTGDLTTMGLFTCSGDFVIQTDATGFSGSFIDMGGLAGGGMFYMDRIMTCSTLGDPLDDMDPLGWHYISAPIDGVSTDDMSDYYVNQWDEVGDMWMNYAGTQPCVNYAPAQTLDGMEVWSVKYDQQWPYAGEPGGPCPQAVNGTMVMYGGPFVGLHTGPYAAAATFSGGLYTGWNMFGNPYPSGLDLNAVVWDPAAVPGAALYDACVGNYGYWTPAIGAYSMPVGNGFFTEFTAPGTFSLAGTERAHGPDFFYKEELSSLLTLEATGSTSSDITHIRFMENAEAGFAKDGDFHKLFSTAEGLPQMYTVTGEDKLAINALPATSMVPLGFTSATTGTYTISAIETSEFTDVVLEDLVTGEQTDLLSNSYTFDYTLNDDADRFMVHFSALGLGDNAAASINIWSNDRKIYVQSPEINGEIVVFNMMGQEVIRTEIEPGLNILPVNDGNSYYVVKVIGSDVAKTGKVYVK